MNLIKRNQINHDDGAGQNGGNHWHIIQRMLLRLQLTACQSKNERELKKAKDYGLDWKRRYFELKSVADKMMEQFEHESTAQKNIIGSVKKVDSHQPIGERILIHQFENLFEVQRLHF